MTEYDIELLKRKLKLIDEMNEDDYYERRVKLNSLVRSQSRIKTIRKIFDMEKNDFPK